MTIKAKNIKKRYFLYKNRISRDNKKEYIRQLSGSKKMDKFSKIMSSKTYGKKMKSKTIGIIIIKFL